MDEWGVPARLLRTPFFAPDSLAELVVQQHACIKAVPGPNLVKISKESGENIKMVTKSVSVYKWLNPLGYRQIQTDTNGDKPLQTGINGVIWA